MIDLNSENIAKMLSQAPEAEWAGLLELVGVRLQTKVDFATDKRSVDFVDEDQGREIALALQTLQG